MFKQICKSQHNEHQPQVLFNQIEHYEIDLLDIDSSDSQQVPDAPKFADDQVNKKEPFMTKSEISSFVRLYKENLSKWSMFGLKLAGKKQRYLKNFFRNNLRNFSSKLNFAERKARNFQRNLIDPASLHLLLDIFVLINKVFDQLPQCYSEASIFKTHDLILYHCFEAEDLDQEVLVDLCRRVRRLKKLFKNLPNIRKHFNQEGFIQKLAEKIYNFEMHIVDTTEKKKENRFVKQIKMIQAKKNQSMIAPSHEQFQLRSFKKFQKEKNQRKENPAEFVQIVEQHQLTQKQQDGKKSLYSSTSYESNVKVEEGIASPSKLFSPTVQYEQFSDEYYDRMMMAQVQAWNWMMSDPHYQDYLKFRMAMTGYHYEPNIQCRQCRCQHWCADRK